MSSSATVLSQFLRDQRAKLAQRLGRNIEPWMKTRELDIIVESLAICRPAHCLEWGAGASTLYFPSRLPSLVSWLSIEHDRAWHDTTASRNQDPRVALVCIPPDRGDYPGTRQEGSYADFKAYVEYPASLGRRFDFIFIDGRARAACLAQAFDLVTDQGLVILHDANRDRYVESLPPFAHLLRLTDYRKNRGGILLASRGRAIEEFIDVRRHQRLWRGHDRLAKWLLMR
jgi:hypothetical protein